MSDEIQYTNGKRTVTASKAMARNLLRSGYKPVQPGAIAEVEAEDAAEQANAEAAVAAETPEDGDSLSEDFDIE